MCVFTCLLKAQVRFGFVLFGFSSVHIGFNVRARARSKENTYPREEVVNALDVS